MQTNLKRATYTLDMAAEILGISRSAAHRAARRGQIPTLRFGNKILVARKALERLLEIGTTTVVPSQVRQTGRKLDRLLTERPAGKGQR